jgi:N-acetylglucosaminyldiphosphoundecaprenol N-acetyl-beta-D-mannosaminyltransferase
MMQTSHSRLILGIRFLVCGAQEAVVRVSRAGGLVVMPSAPALKNLPYEPEYREALLEADFALPDSALMVVLWNLLEHDNIAKLSGLKYLRALIAQEEFREPGASFWVMPTACALEHNQAWLGSNGIRLEDEEVYVAPMYGAGIEDPELLRRIEERRPRHVVLGLGGGVQERLGLYLKRNLSYRPAIHCIGAAIAFLTGDQVRIPVWADSMGLGWLWRTMSDPRRFAPRYWRARNLAPLLLRCRDRLPQLDVDSAPSLLVQLQRPAGPDGLSGARDASEA